MKVGRDQSFVVNQESAAESNLLPRAVLDVDEHHALVGPLDQIAQIELGQLGGLSLSFLRIRIPGHNQRRAGESGGRDRRCQTGRALYLSRAIIEAFPHRNSAHGIDPVVTCTEGRE